MEILAAEETGRQEITPGTPVLVKGAPEVVVDLAGVARIRARGPAGTVEELREEVNKEASNLEALTAGFGTADMDELEAKSEQFNRIQQKVSDAQTRLDTLLSNTTAEEIEQESRKTETDHRRDLTSLPRLDRHPSGCRLPSHHRQGDQAGLRHPCG